MFDITELHKMIDEKLVSVQKHPEADYFIYNYGPKAQYERIWNEITMQCRGLILDQNHNVIARPFKKFFNLEEHSFDDIPKTPFEVYEKMDGSLGILYWIGNKPFIATRGSFKSDQAKKANQILNQKYSHTFSKLDTSKTYLFEILFPENRIVCNYGNLEDLVLLAIIDNQTGKDCELEQIGFPIVKRYDGINDINSLKELEEENREGFVVKFQNGFRLKVKFQEYVRLHRILTQVSTKNIWQNLSEGNDFDEILNRVPDEFYNWVKETKSNLEDKFKSIEEEYKWIYKTISRIENISRAEFAECAKKYKYSAILFKMLDGKKYDDVIWRVIKPEYERPFLKNIEI